MRCDRFERAVSTLAARLAADRLHGCREGFVPVVRQFDDLAATPGA